MPLSFYLTLTSMLYVHLLQLEIPVLIFQRVLAVALIVVVVAAAALLAVVIVASE